MSSINLDLQFIKPCPLCGYDEEPDTSCSECRGYQKVLTPLGEQLIEFLKERRVLDELRESYNI